MCRLLFFLLAVAPLSAVAATSQPMKKGAESGSLRFLCVSPDLPPKYKRAPNGAYSAIPYDFDECPPTSLYQKRGSEYVTCAFSSNGLSPAIPLGSTSSPASVSTSGAASSHSSDTSKSPEGFYVKDTGVAKIEKLDAQGQGVIEPKSSKRGGDAEKAAWQLLMKSPPDDGRHYLACLFQPKVTGKWFPPEIRLIDISPEALPADRCLVINCMLVPAVVQVGEGTRPLPVPPSGGFLVAGGGGAPHGKVSIKAATAGQSGMTVALNREMDLPAGRRAILVFYPALPTPSAPVKAKVKYYLMDDSSVSAAGAVKPPGAKSRR